MKLVYANGELTGRQLEIPNNEMIIGRESDCHLVLKDEGISRHHARLFYDAAYVVVEDLDSHNGVYVNDKRIANKQTLVEGDSLSIGEQVFRIVPSTVSKKSSPIRRVFLVLLILLLLLAAIELLWHVLP